MDCKHGTCTRLRKGQQDYCHSHLAQWKRWGETWDFGTAPHRQRKPCGFDGCGRDATWQGLCHSHAVQRRRGQELRALPEPLPEAAPGYSFCSSCRQFWPEDAFSEKYGRNRREYICKDCQAAKERARRQRSSAVASTRRSLLRGNYGIEPEDYEALYESQGGRCAICRDPVNHYLRDISQSGRNTHVDHCHDSGAVRGILCHGCNVGLGGFRDEVGRLTAAIKYLTRSTGVAHATLPG